MSKIQVVTWTILAAIPAFAAGVGPCTDGASNETILPVRNSVTTYCTSDYGWSDTWFKGFHNVYNQQLDVFSGEDSFNLRWIGMTGSGWLSPSMDRGTTVPQFVGSPWSVLQAIDYVTPGLETQTRSVIGHADGLEATITTTLVNNLLSINFVFENTNSSGSIGGLVFSDYFNFHPNGSLHGNQSTRQGTTSYLANCPAHLGTCTGAIYTTGNTALSTYIANGLLYGERAPDGHAVGYASGVPNGQTALYTQLANGTINGASGPVGPGDTAGVLSYNLGSLSAGQSVAFTFYKQIDTGIPEPGTWGLTLVGFGTVVAIRRIRRSKRG